MLAAPRGAPVLPSRVERPSFAGVESLMSTSADGEVATRLRSAKADGLHRRHRLIKREVETLLREGTRFARAEFTLSLVENSVGLGRMAIAVPKRILKLAVDRNRVRRTIREVFRQHRLRNLPVDVLVTLRSQLFIQSGVTKSGQHQRLGETLTSLFADVTRRFGASQC